MNRSRDPAEGNLQIQRISHDFSDHPTDGTSLGKVLQKSSNRLFRVCLHQLATSVVFPRSRPVSDSVSGLFKSCAGSIREIFRGFLQNFRNRGFIDFPELRIQQVKLSRVHGQQLHDSWIFLHDVHHFQHFFHVVLHIHHRLWLYRNESEVSECPGGVSESLRKVAIQRQLKNLLTDNF